MSVLFDVVQKLLELPLLELFLVLLGLLCFAHQSGRLLLYSVMALLFDAGLDGRGEV